MSSDPDGGGLASRTLSGLSWVYAGLATTTALQLVYSAVVSRIILPQAFGIFALSGVVIRLGAFFSQFGFASALVQKPALDDADVPTTFLIGVGIALTVAMATALAGIPAANALRHPEVRDIVAILSIDLPLAALGAPSLALLRRDFNFRRLAEIDVASFVGGYLVIGTVLAVAGLGVWSLAAAALAQTAIESALAFACTRHPVRRLPRWLSVRQLGGFGWKVSAIGIIEYFGQNSDTIVVGRELGASALGQYSKASSLAMLPLQQLVSGLTRVLTSAFSRAQALGRARDGFTQGSSLVAGLLVPAGAWLAIVGHDLVSVLYGPRWSTAASLMPVLALAATLNLLSLLPAIIMEARAQLNEKLTLTIGHLGVFVALLTAAAMLKHGLIWYASAWAASEAVRVSLYVTMVCRRLRARIALVLRGMLEGLILAGAAALLGYPLRTVTARPWVGLCIGTAGWILGFTIALSANPKWLLRQAIRDRAMLSALPVGIRNPVARVLG